MRIAQLNVSQVDRLIPSEVILGELNKTSLPKGKPGRIFKKQWKRFKNFVKCEYFTKNSRFEYVEIPEGKEIVQSIALAKHGIDMMIRDEIDFILVGRDVLEKLRRTVLDSPFSSYANLDFYNGKEMKVIGIEVRYVPWMTGWVLVPKTDKPRTEPPRRYADIARY